MYEEVIKELESRITLYNCFFDYIKKYKDKINRGKFLPQNLIKLYYGTMDDSFNLLKRSFVKKYIYNESEVEAVHEKWERMGLKRMYNFINSYDLEKMDIYTILELHEELYRYAPNKDFGGHFRNIDVYLPGSGTNLSEWRSIRYEILEMKPYVNELRNEGLSLSETEEFDKMFLYIENV